MSALTSSTCKVCGKPLTRLQQLCGNVCDRLACRAPLLREQSARAEQAERDAREAIRANALDELQQQSPELIQRVESAAANLVVMVVPSFAGTLEPMPQQRRLRFEDHLDAALARAQNLLTSPEKRDHLRRAHENYHTQPSSLAVVNACSTCRGYCCKNGGDHAFVTAEFLAWRLLDEPQQTADRLRAEYVARIPEAHYPHSCLFQSPQGCVLPRSTRGTTCNGFECAGITEHNAILEENPDHPSVAMAHDAETQVVTRIGIMNAAGVREEVELMPLDEE